MRWFIIMVLAATAFVGLSCEAEGRAPTKNTTPPSNTLAISTQQGTTTPPEDASTYSILYIGEVVADVDGSVSISGATDLPDGAGVTVDFNVAGRAASDAWTGVEQRATVSDGIFSVTLVVPQRPEFVNGPYEVSVFFTPRRQSESVLRLVGEDGEHLTGNLVDDEFGFRTMELVEDVELNLAVTPPAYVFQLPSEFAPDSAERALAEYLRAWRSRDWGGMAAATQLTWLDDTPDPTGLLEDWYGFKVLLGFEIQDVEMVSSVTTDIIFVVHYEAITNQISKKLITARVVRETAPYSPSENGAWGVNPTSTVRETDAD